MTHPTARDDVPSNAFVENLRVAVYSQLAETGRVEDTEGLAARLQAMPESVRTGLRLLHDRHDLVLDEAGSIVLAHPFATRSFGFSVMGEDTLWWGGCAWDAFAIVHLVGRETSTLVATTCPQCRSPHAWNINRNEPPRGDQAVYFATPMAKAWEDVIHTCSNQRIFCDNRCIDEYLVTHPRLRGGARFDIATLWHLASNWYAGRLEHGYRRREPASAASYFRQVGLTGPFWGTA
jgi:Alkylmercury lyase